MPDIEKVIHELDEWINDPNAMDTTIDACLVADALELLKEQDGLAKALEQVTATGAHLNAEKEMVITDLKERIAIMTETGWIKTEDKTPKLYEDLWLYNQYTKEVVRGCCFYDWTEHIYKFYVEATGARFVTVADDAITHWQYFIKPEPPKEGDPE